jgi:hypothetical protein
VGKPEGKRQLGRPRRRWGIGSRWEDGLSIDLTVMGWGVKWIQLAQDRARLRVLVNTAMNLRVLAQRR